MLAGPKLAVALDLEVSAGSADIRISIDTFVDVK
jgi:hypothetical protein